MVTLALKTLVLIDKMVAEDQGASFRQFLGKLIPEAKDAYEGKKDDFRSHLGASMIGRECPRQLYYNFRWAKAPKFDGRMIRLFNRGHLEEPRLVALIQMIGSEVWSHDENNDQFRVSYHGGHFGSAIDAVIDKIPDLPPEPLLGEFKTSGSKAFKKLAGTKWKDFMEYVANPYLPRVDFNGEGVKIAKFEHYVQMQIYMGYYQLKKALYLAVCKDDDLLYGEIIDFDQETYDAYVERGRKIVFMNSGIPTRINDSIGFFKCKHCDVKDVCHQGATPARNCRTCASAVATDSGEWQCITHEKYLTKTQQLAACGDYDMKMEFLDQ